MSWASHNPEAWDEICVNGIVQKIEDAMKVYAEPIDAGELRDVIHAIQETADGEKVFDALLTWAQKEVVDAEADYFGGLIDAACERTG